MQQQLPYQGRIQQSLRGASRVLAGSQTRFISVARQRDLHLFLTSPKIPCLSRKNMNNNPGSYTREPAMENLVSDLEYPSLEPIWRFRQVSTSAKRAGGQGRIIQGMMPNQTQEHEIS